MKNLEDAVERGRQQVVPLLQQLLAFDTDIGVHDDPPRDDRRHQEFVAGFLAGLGAEVELLEPAEDVWSSHPMALPGQSFQGRPILWARLPGSGGGPSLLFNGHYDTVLADPLDAWTRDPREGQVVDGQLYGRGACDMKGGNAAAMAAVAGLVEAGVELPGDVFFNFVPFEEVNGMGTTATMLTGHRADAAVCCEPTELRPLIACRGVIALELEVEGRLAHAEIAQPHHSEGGGVNGIEKLVDLLLAVRELNERWRDDETKTHPHLSTPFMLTSLVEGGSFWASWPATAKATFDLTYLPGDADADGYGSKVREEVERHISAAAEADEWLKEHPPRLNWLVDYPPVEVDERDPIVVLAEEVAKHPGGVGGFDSWADQVNLVREGGIPTVLLGPGSILQAHTADEYVPVADLERCVEIYAGIASNWVRG